MPNGKHIFWLRSLIRVNYYNYIILKWMDWLYKRLIHLCIERFVKYGVNVFGIDSIPFQFRLERKKSLSLQWLLPLEQWQKLVLPISPFKEAQMVYLVGPRRNHYLMILQIAPISIAKVMNKEAWWVDTTIVSSSITMPRKQDGCTHRTRASKTTLM